MMSLRALVTISLIPLSIKCFEIISIIPKLGSTSVKGGGKLVLSCNVDDPWEWCAFTHVTSGKLCTFHWKRQPSNLITVEGCDSFKGRFEYLTEYDEHKCGIGISGMRPEEGGEWRCDLEMYSSPDKGIGPKVNRTFQVDVGATSETPEALNLQNANEVGVAEASNPGGFAITSYSPASGSTAVKEDESLDLWCNVDDWWEWCTFTHVSSGNFCDLKWKKDPWNVTLNDCDDFEGRVKYLGEYDQHKCGLRFYNIRSNETGHWKCDLERYQYAETKRGYGDTVKVTFMVDVEATTTSTSTTTTSPIPDLPIALRLEDIKQDVQETTDYFSLVSYIPETGRTTISGGDSLELWCNVDDWWEWCTFSHVPSGRVCDFQWKSGPWNVTINDCNDFDGMYDYLGDYNNHKCGIRIYNMNPDESGEWRCDLESYNRAETKRGHGYQVRKSFDVQVNDYPQQY